MFIKGDSVYFVQGGLGIIPERLILCTFSHYTEKGNAVVKIYRKGLLITKPLDTKELSLQPGENTSTLAHLDLRPSMSLGSP